MADGEADRHDDRLLEDVERQHRLVGVLQETVREGEVEARESRWTKSTEPRLLFPTSAVTWVSRGCRLT
jgi:hypothetical protein